jgi:hypothetical protein
MLCCLSLWAQTNVVNKTLPFATNYSIAYFPKDAGILIKIPDYKSESKFPKLISFSEAQKWEVKKLIDKYFSYSTVFRENNIKSFSKSIGSIPQPKEDWKWAVGMEATIYVSEVGKSLLILESKSALTQELSVFVLDSDDALKIVDLIKMIPDMEKESLPEPSK